MEPHIITPENAAKMSDWLKTRGGLAIWRSVNLSNPGASWTTPVRMANGVPYEKPTWESDTKPERIITDPAEVVVSVDKEVKRFHVAIKRGDSFNFTLTTASNTKVKNAVRAAGEGAYYVFDYDFQDCVIMAPDKQMPLTEWEAQRGITVS